MKFYSNIYNNILNKPSFKFLLNIFFLKQINSVNFSNLLVPYFFLNTKTLKIKKLLSKNFNLYLNIVLIFTIFLIICLINFSRLVVRTAGFHPANSGSIPGWSVIKKLLNIIYLKSYTNEKFNKQNNNNNLKSYLTFCKYFFLFDSKNYTRNKKIMLSLYLWSSHKPINYKDNKKKKIFFFYNYYKNLYTYRNF